MIVNFDFYIQKTDGLDAEYKFYLDTYSSDTYNQTLLKEGTLHVGSNIMNRDMIDLDLPTNDTDIVKNWFSFIC